MLHVWCQVSHVMYHVLQVLKLVGVGLCRALQGFLSSMLDTDVNRSSVYQDIRKKLSRYKGIACFGIQCLVGGIGTPNVGGKRKLTSL